MLIMSKKYIVLRTVRVCLIEVWRYTSACIIAASECHVSTISGQWRGGHIHRVPLWLCALGYHKTCCNGVQVWKPALWCLQPPSFFVQRDSWFPRKPRIQQSVTVLVDVMSEILLDQSKMVENTNLDLHFDFKWFLVWVNNLMSFCLFELCRTQYKWSVDIQTGYL